jgi:two-component system, sensor histidine kinase and response regulator
MADSKRYILIVDDNLNNLQITAKILKDEGYLISLAQDAASALEQLGQIVPDLILLDIMMPVIDGLELCRIIKKNDKLSEIPVIFLTAKKQTEDLSEGFRAGGVDYITKPFKREELLIRVRNHIDLAASKKWILEMNKSRDKLYSIIAHDIRSPLASIQQTVSAIAGGHIVPGTPEYREILDYLEKMTADTTMLLDNLLTYTRAQGKSPEIIPKHADLAPVLFDCINLMEGSASRKKISLDFTIPEEIEVFFDETSIHAVIRNILFNAIKFTPENGKVFLTAVIDGDFVTINITDTGIGMPEELQRKIFINNEHFTSPGTNREQGSGLGTFIIKDFISKNNGKLEIKSIPGKGTEVKIMLPVNS